MHIYICILHLLVQVCPKKFHHQISVEAVQLQISNFTLWKILFSAVRSLDTQNTDRFYSQFYFQSKSSSILHERVVPQNTDRKIKHTTKKLFTVSVSAFSHFNFKNFDQTPYLLLNPFSIITHTHTSIITSHYCHCLVLPPSFCHWTCWLLQPAAIFLMTCKTIESVSVLQNASLVSLAILLFD